MMQIAFRVLLTCYFLSGEAAQLVFILPRNTQQTYIVNKRLKTSENRLNRCDSLINPADSWQIINHCSPENKTPPT